MTAISKQKYDEYYEEHQKYRYHDFMKGLSENLSFFSDTWICEKKIRRPGQLVHEVTIYFSRVPEAYKEMVKYYAIIRLLDGRGINRVRGNVRKLTIFFDFLKDVSLTELSVMTASRFKEYLDSKGYAESTRSSIWSAVGMLLNRMNGFDEMTLKNPFYDNPYQSKQLVDQKYIPEYVANQLDRIFMRDDILYQCGVFIGCCG